MIIKKRNIKVVELDKNKNVYILLLKDRNLLKDQSCASKETEGEIVD